MSAAAITALRKRLSRWELDHLRTHSAELANRLAIADERIAALEAENYRAWRTADSWHEEAMQLVNELQDEGKEVGLTQSGALVVMPEAQPAASATDAIANALAHAITPIGTHLPAQGGTLGAIIARRDGTIYGLIVADAQHEITGIWGAYDQDVTGAQGTDGAANTRAMAAAGSDTAKAVLALTIGGHTDWFIGSRLQMLTLYETAPELFSTTGWYLTSSQYSRSTAWWQDFEYGLSSAGSKASEFRARPVRSIQLQPSSTSTLSTPIAEGEG